jgi:hypothetical protein
VLESAFFTQSCAVGINVDPDTTYDLKIAGNANFYGRLYLGKNATESVYAGGTTHGTDGIIVEGNDVCLYSD